MSTEDQIKDLTLPSGGTVSFSSIDDLTARDVRDLRKARDIEGNGSFYNAMTQKAMELLIDDWRVPYRQELRTPRYDKRATDLLKARDLVAIENHIAPHVLRLINGTEEDLEDRSPGSPTPPASE